MGIWTGICPLSLAFAVERLGQHPAQITALPAHESLINQSSRVDADARDMAAAYAKPASPTAQGLQELGVALQAGYVFQPKQHQGKTPEKIWMLMLIAGRTENRVGMTRHRFLLVAAPALLLAWLPRRQSQLR